MVLDFHTRGTAITLDLFAGMYPVVKMNFNLDMVKEGRLGELLASKDIVKVIGRADVDNMLRKVGCEICWNFLRC